MCGRFVLKDNIKDLSSCFHIDDFDDLFPEPRYNICPGQNVPVIIMKDRKMFIMMRWGLVPSWSNDPLIGFQMINARAETLTQKPSFKNSFKKHRCIIPCSGFYEWEKIDKKTKMPYYIRHKNGEPFALAGLWDEWNNDGGNLTTFTIITTTPNKIIEPIHDRMPVILKAEDHDMWLNPDIKNTENVITLLKPYPAEEMELYEISTYVNNPKNDSPECIEPL